MQYIYRFYTVICKVSVSAAHTDESLRGGIPWEQIPPTGRAKSPEKFERTFFSSNQTSFKVEVCCDNLVGEEFFRSAWMFGLNRVPSLINVVKNTVL